MLISIKFDYGVFVDNLLLNSLFIQRALYTEDIKLYLYDNKNNRNSISNPDYILFSRENILNYIIPRNGRYYFDFKLDYNWQLKDLSYQSNALFDIHAYINLKNIHVQVKIASVKNELISPIDIGQNNVLYSGDVSNDGFNDIGFGGGYLESKENNERWFIKYSCSYLFDVNQDFQFDEIDERIIFAEFVVDAKFESNLLVNYLFDDFTPPFKQIILGDEILLNLTTSGNVDKAYLLIPSLNLKIGDFTKVKGTNNKYQCNWTDIKSLLSVTYDSGDEIDIEIIVFDTYLGLNDSLIITCLLDFVAPDIVITVGDGNTDYSSSNYATPWTNYNIEIYENLDGIINHSDYYYSEIYKTSYQIKIFNLSQNEIYKSRWIALEKEAGTLKDLQVPLREFVNFEDYYYIIEFKAIDAAGNSNNQSNYFYNINKLFISNKVSLEIGNNLINVNDLYDQEGSSLSFSLIDAAGNEVQNQALSLKSGNYNLKTPIWDALSQSYILTFNNTLDLLIHSDNIFDGSMIFNYVIDNSKNWEVKKDDHYVFVKHASQKDPLIMEYILQKEITTIINISDLNSFQLINFINPKEVYCYIFNNNTGKYDLKREFTTDEYTVYENGTVFWNAEIDFSSLNIKDNVIIFSYYGSEYANLIKDSQKNGIFMKILIPNIYSTHGTIEKLSINFHTFDNNFYSYQLNSLDFDRYFQEAVNYKKIIPGVGEVLEIPIYIDFARLLSDDLSTLFDISEIYAISFSIFDAIVWPGEGDVNYPYQLFGLSELSFYEILSDKSNLTILINNIDFDCPVDPLPVLLNKYDSHITSLEIYKDKRLLSFDVMNIIQFADVLDVYFQLNDNTINFPIYEMSTPLVGVIDLLSNTLIGLAIVKWDDSLKKYHCRFTIAEDIMEDGVENYNLQFSFFPTDIEDPVNSTETLSIDLIPQTVSRICLWNDREIIINDEYAFDLKTKFTVKYEDSLHFKGYILDNSTYYRKREIIPYNVMDLVDTTKLIEYEIDLNGLIGDSNFIDANNFKIEFINRKNYNSIESIFEMVEGDIIFHSDIVENAWIEYYDYYNPIYPNKFVLKVQWNEKTLNHLPFDTSLLLTYKIMQGKKIIPATFETRDNAMTSVNFRKFDYNTFSWVNTDIFNEIINLNIKSENSSLFVGVSQDASLQIDKSSVGSGIIGLKQVWKRVEGKFKVLNSSFYSFIITTENGVDALKLVYTGTGIVDLIIEYKFIPILTLTHRALENFLEDSFIKVNINNKYLHSQFTYNTDYSIIGSTSSNLIFYTFFTTISQKSSINDSYFIHYKGYLTEEVNLVKNLLLEFLDLDGIWKPIAKIPVSMTGDFDFKFFMGESGLQFPLNQETFMRIIYLPINLTNYDNLRTLVNYSGLNPVYVTSHEVYELFTLTVNGKTSKLNYIPTEFSNAVDRWTPVRERIYVTTSNPYEKLEEGKPYTYLDLHKTITDTYNFQFELVDEINNPIPNNLVFMEIGWKPKAGLNYKIIDWEDESGDYIDFETLGTASFKEEGQKVYLGPGVEGVRSKMYNRPEKWEYLDPLTGQIKEYSSYYYDYRISDSNGLVSFNFTFNDDYLGDHHRIFDEALFSSGSVTQDSLDDYRLYIRVFHAPIYDIEEMALTNKSNLLCTRDNAFDSSRLSELDCYNINQTVFYSGSYVEGLITLYPEDLMLGASNVLVYQLGSDVSDTFSFDVEVVEADLIPDVEIMSIEKLKSNFESNDLIPEFTNNSYMIHGMPIGATITNYSGVSPFLEGNVQFSANVRYDGIATFNISDYYLNQLDPGVYQINIYTSSRTLTKEAYRFCTLECRPEDFLKFGEPTMRLDLLNWYDSGLGGAYFGSDYAFYEDIYPRLTGYLATPHNATSDWALSDYVEVDFFAKTRDIGESDWSSWIELGSEDIYISSLVYDGLYYFELPLGLDGEMFMGKQVQLNISANAFYNQTGMEECYREQKLYILNLSLVTSTIRNDTETLQFYSDTDTGTHLLGDTVAGNEYGVERYFEYTTIEDTYGIDADDVLLNLRGFSSIEIVEVKGLKDYNEYILEDTEYSIDGISIILNPQTTLDNYSDIIISYSLTVDKNRVLEWNFSKADGFEHSTTIFNSFELKPDNYLGLYYSKFNETYKLDSSGVTKLDKSFTGITLDDVKIFNYNISESLSEISIDEELVQLDFTGDDQYIWIEYGIATYYIDRGYQRIAYKMSDSVRKLSKLRSTHKIYDHGISSDVDLLTIPNDPEDPMEAGDSKILIPILEDNKTTITFNQLALLYDTVLNGSFYLDDCVLASGKNNLKPILATFTFITEDGESYFDFVNIESASGKNRFDFEISLQSIYATKGYTTLDVEIDFLSHGDNPEIIQYVLFDYFELTADDRILQTIDKPMLKKDGSLDTLKIINTPHWIQIFTDNLQDAYGVYDDAWLTLAVEGFSDYGELVKLYQDGNDELQFLPVDENEFSFQSLAITDRRLVDSLGLHINAYDLELPKYIEGEVNLYGGIGKYPYGEVYVSDMELAMNWGTIDNDYIVDTSTFNAGDYNAQNFLLTTQPITSQGVYAEGELYLHHQIDISNPSNIITTGLPSGVEFAIEMLNETSRIDSVDISYIDRISAPNDWVESWQGFSLTQEDFNEIPIYNPFNARTYSIPSTVLVESIDYELTTNDNGKYQVNFFDTAANVISALSSDIIQIDFHINYEFTENDDYVINEGPNTYDVELHWIFPNASCIDWRQFEYHPDITDSTSFNVSFSHISEYASESDFKSTYTETFQFYPNEYNFTEFEFTEFDDDEYEVTLNLTGGGDFQDRFDDVKPFGMLIQTDSGERYLDEKWFFSWQNISDTEPIFSFNLPKLHFRSIGLLEESEILVTYYYPKESLSYYAEYDNILTAATYDFIIKNSEGTHIFNLGNLSSVEGNNITFTENIKNYLDIGENLTIQYDYKTIGGLLDTKHVFIEVQPYHMKFYNNYYPFSGASIVSPLYYNLSANYQYQMALNYRLQEKSILSSEFTINDIIGNMEEGYHIEFDLSSTDIPSLYSDDTPMAVAYFINESGSQKYFTREKIDYDIINNRLILDITDEYTKQELAVNSKIYVSFYADLHNKYQYYHSLTVDLTNDEITLLNWTTTQSPEDTLMANYESSHFIYDVDPYESINRGKVQQIFAILNNTNSLIYYVTEDLNDATNGWNSFDTLIMKMGFLNPDVLDFLSISFYHNLTPGQDELIGWTKVSLDMFEDDSGTMYITLPVSSDWDKFTIANDARIMFTPVFNNATEFNGDFYGQGLPTTQTVEWDSDTVVNGYLNIDLLRKIFSDTQSIIVLNDIFEPIYEITLEDIDTRIEEYEIYDNRRNYEVEFNNISLPESYLDPNNNLMYMKDGDILYLKYNATLLASIGFTVDEMVLQRTPFIKNYDTGANDVPFAEISLLGVSGDGNIYTLEDIYENRDKLVAWEDKLDLTPFESEFYDTYQQKVFNISFDDIYTNFKVLDAEGIEHCYILDVMITSNDPRYEIIVDSFFIFEFDYNANLYDSEIFDMYPNNHMEEFYYGDFSDIYSEVRVLDTSEFLPLYSDDHNINETLYFDVFDSDGNWYYFNSHLFGQNTSAGVYDITFNPEYSEEYYLRYLDSQGTQTLANLYDYYVPHIANFSYLYISWADANAWKEWRTIATPNINISTLDLTFEWYNDTLQEYESVNYNQTLYEFEARNIAIETIYPFASTGDTAIFNLSQSYSNAQNLDIMMIKGYYFNESSEDFDPSNSNFKFNFKTLEISASNGKNLYIFEKIVVYINFTEGVYSDYTQFKLLDNAITNHPDAPTWAKNDTLYVDYEYKNIDYFLLMEEYTVGSEDSMFEFFNYTRNDKFMVQNPIDLSYSLEMAGQYENFQNFTRENDLKTVLEFIDFDEDGTHELVVQKDDITGNGIFDSFKYGFVNPAGEISFHTLFQEATSVEINSDKKSDIQITEEYQIDWDDWFRSHYVVAQRTITSNTTTTTRKEVTNTLIQKDTDFDGSVDSEVGFEVVITTMIAETYTEEVTHLHFTPTVNNLFGSEGDAWLKEYRNSTTIYSDTIVSYTFRDFYNDNVISTRYYDDIFPNDLSEMYNLDNNLVSVYNDLDDDDPSNDIVVQAPALEQLLTFSHERDGVSAIYDRKIIVEEGTIHAENILATEKVLSIPGTYDEVTGIANYMSEQEIKADVIEVIPPQGVYFDNNPQYGPDRITGYSYYYFDESGDGQHSTIFIGKTDGKEIKAIGFDYDGDGIFLPFKTQAVEKHIISSESSSSASESFADYVENKYDGSGLINFKDYKNYEGLFLEPTFRDSLFDIWKSQYTGQTTELIEQVKSLTVHTFLETLSADKIFGDLRDQMDAIFVGLAFGTGLGKAGATIGPITAGIGYLAGFFIGYLARSLAQQSEKQRALNYYIASQTFHNPTFESTQTLSSKWWNDEYFGDIMPNTLQGNPRGVYTPVKIETDRYAYEGEVILAPRGTDKTSGLDAQIKRIALDYPQQTRSYIAYSDFDDPRMQSFLFPLIEVEYHDDREGPKTRLVNVPRSPDILYMKNSILYIENAIDNATTTNDDDHYDRLLPYMIGPYPQFIFADTGGSITIPEFYLEYPIMVDSDKYTTLGHEYYSIYKIFDESSNSIQIIPESNTHKLYSQITSFDAYLMNSIGQETPLGEFKDCYTFDSSTGTLTLDSDIYISFTELIASNPNTYIVFEFKVEKYRDFTDTSITSEAQNYRIATMQSIHASILDYIYQATIAQNTQERLNEIAYTVFITTVSTALSLAMSCGMSAVNNFIAKSFLTASESIATISQSVLSQTLSKSITSRIGMAITKGMFKLIDAIAMETYEELNVDPWIEAYVSKSVRDLGGNSWEQIFWSSLAESGRETGLSMVTQSMGAITVHSQLQQSQNLDITPQSYRNDVAQMNADQRAQRTETLGDQIKDTLISSLLVFGGLASGAIFGSIGAGFANMMIPIGMMIETGGDLKDTFEKSLKAKKLQVPNANDIHSEVSDAWKSRIVREVEGQFQSTILSEAQKQFHMVSPKDSPWVGMGMNIAMHGSASNSLNKLLVPTTIRGTTYGFIDQERAPDPGLEKEIRERKEDQEEIGSQLDDQITSALEFLEVFRSEVEKIIPSQLLTRTRFGEPLTLSLSSLSRLFYDVDYRISKKIVRPASLHPEYVIAQDVVMKWINDLESRLSTILRSSPSRAIYIAQRYMDIHKGNMPISRNPDKQIYRFHPAIDQNYFGKIDTLDKVYWLGFFFGDGWIVSRKPEGKRTMIGLKLGATKFEYLKSNCHQLIRWCRALGLNPDYIKSRYEFSKKYGDIRLRLSLGMRFSSSQIAQDLLDYGFHGSKSKSETQWPSIDWHVKDSLKPIFDLVFTYGLYDAEGHVGKTSIRMKSRAILESIRDRLHIPFEVIPEKSGEYYLTLSASLLNLMQIIYPKGLEFKRKTFNIHRYKNVVFDNVMTKELLTGLTEIISVAKIAEIFNVNVNRVQDLMNKWGITCKSKTINYLGNRNLK